MEHLRQHIDQNNLDSSLDNSFRGKLYNFLTRRLVYHSLAWLAILFILVLIEYKSSDESFLFTLSNELINVFIYAVVVYFNLLYLIPNYLTKKKFLTYIALLILTALVITPLKAMLFYIKFIGHPEMQASVSHNLNLSFLPPLFLAGASTVFKIIADWVTHLREKQELETRTMQSELNFLKSQINPHFLFNTLNNLYALTLKKSDKAPEIVIKLSEMMRYMLYECNEKRVPLRKEVNYLRNYLDLERLRQAKNIDIQFEVTGMVSDQQLAPLLFIPFLENSFKHGLNNHIDQGFVRIRLHVDEQKVNFSIVNSKPEKLPVQDPRRRSGGIGLVNVRRRLNILYPNHYSLNIENNPKTYEVTLDLELA